MIVFLAIFQFGFIKVEVGSMEVVVEFAIHFAIKATSCEKVQSDATVAMGM